MSVESVRGEVRDVQGILKRAQASEAVPVRVPRRYLPHVFRGMLDIATKCTAPNLLQQATDTPATKSYKTCLKR